jgi:manganese oxidase
MNATTTRPGLDPSRSAASLAAWATTLALAGAAWLVWLAGQPSANAAVRHGPHGLAAWVMTSLLALPLIIGGVWVATQLSRFVRTALGATPLSRVLHPVLVSATAAVGLGVGWHLQTTFAGADPPARRLLTAVVLVSPATLVTTLLVASVVAGLTTRSQRLRRPSPRRLVASLSGALVVLSTAALPLTQAESAAAAANSPCPVGATQKTFDVQAIDVDMPLNRFGDHDPNGRMYVLSDKVAAVRAEESSQHVSIGLRDDAIQPLVVRANGGDCVTITYTDNASGGDFGLHIDGLAFDATSSGDAVGNNPSSVPASGETQTYTYYVPRDPTLEGAHYLHPGPGFRDFVNHGLFGSLVVEPPGSTYLDPNAPDEAHAHALESGWEAIIRPALGAEFRENVQLYHEIGNENEKNAVLQSNGEAVPFVDPHTDAYRPDTRAINYRSEGFYDRLEEAPDQEAHGYGSYTFGDVATPMPRGYQADPTKFRILHAGGEMFHVFHMHGGGIRWRMNPVADPTWDYGDTGLDKHPLPLTDSERLDSQAFGPGESYNLEIEGGAGGVQQGAGDFLFHCHIAEHYVAGMWSFWRVYDTAQSNFAPLADRVAPPAPVDSTELVGRTYDGQTITEANLDDWVRPQLPPQGVRHNHLDAAVWNWATNPNKPTQYLGEPEDTRHPDYADYYRTVPGHPTALPDDTFVGHRPVIKFNPLNGRPAFPLLRPHLGMRPPFAPNGHSGAPYLGEMGDQPAKAGASIDPWAGRADGICPAKQADGSPTQLRRFNVVAIQRAVQVTPKDVDPTGMIYSLAHDKRAVMRGAKPFEPLALRTNAGECDAVTLTNALKDPEQQVNIHIHHVQFDTQASDGVITGMSYEQAVYPYKAHDPQLTREAVAGSRVLHLSDVTKFHLGSSIGVGLGTEGPAAHGTANAALSGQGPEIRTITAIHPGTRTVRLNAPLVADHRAGQFAGTEFVQYRWYPDVDLDNIFFHDHVDGIHTFAHGLVGQLITEPQGSTYHDPRTGRQIDSGTIADIHTSTPLSVPAGVTGSFRELALWTMDKGFGSTTDSMLNLRANPLVDRQGLNPSQRFSSYRWGDPMTPLPRAYPGDPFVIRTVNVGPTVDTLHIDGHQFSYENRYADAAGDPEATTMNTLHYGISEKYTLILNGGAGGTTQTPGDYLYFNGIDRRLVDGAWGIIRVLAGQVSTDHADPNFLQPLPGRTVAQAAPLPTRTGSASPKAPNTGDPCPTGAPVHHFDITAVRVPDAPNPARYAYVPSGQAAAVLAGRLRPEPLVMHVQRGECVTVLMRNSTKEASVGFHLSGLDSGIASSGVAVGFNPSTAVADGATGLYRYYVGDSRLSGGVIGDLAGSQTAKRGLYGSYTVEPSGTVTTDPRTGEPTDVGSAVDVHEPNGPNYRDFTLALADDDPQMGASFMPYPVNVERPEAVLVNYRRTPRNDRLADAFSSLTFGDPQTPILSAYAGDPMVVHTMVTPGSEQMHSFNLGGLRFAMDSRIVDGNTAETRGVGPWEYSTSQLVGGAGGGRAGDYFYGDMRRVFTKAGMWGLQRVLPPPLTCPTDGAELRCLDGTDTAAGTP